MDYINFTPEKFEELKRAYNHAVEIKAEAFTFEGKAILTNFAKYMIEYLEMKFGGKK